ncbi:hypothetical protein IEO21_03633 [Rhodonia placenta]|uniref:Uncharacterized protein n=1 Tax=Rhodonia placenta TaxID=104341 RepID=A0A8H7U398_9APHY|nr:hypothetical protein IEO21_03633 [Postia placenta]
MRLAASFELCQALDFEWLVPLTQNDTNALYISASTYSVVAAGPSRAVRFSCRHDLEVMVPWTTALLSHFHLQFKDLWVASTHRELDMTILKRTPWVERLHIGSSRYTTMLETLGNKPAYWPKLTKVATLQHCRLLKFAETRAHLGRPLEELECHASRSTYIQDLEKIESHVGVVRLVKDDPFALPLPDVCTDGVPLPYFWPEEWDTLLGSGDALSCMIHGDGGYVLSLATYYTSQCIWVLKPCICTLVVFFSNAMQIMDTHRTVNCSLYEAITIVIRIERCSAPISPRSPPRAERARMPRR